LASFRAAIPAAQKHQTRFTAGSAASARGQPASVQSRFGSARAFISIRGRLLQPQIFPIRRPFAACPLYEGRFRQPAFSTARTGRRPASIDALSPVENRFLES
jgi:hypothetical protein